MCEWFASDVSSAVERIPRGPKMATVKGTAMARARPEGGPPRAGGRGGEGSSSLPLAGGRAGDCGDGSGGDAGGERRGEKSSRKNSSPASPLASPAAGPASA